MPKTIEELEAEITVLKETHATELAAKDVIIEERNTTIATKDQDNASLQGKLENFEQAEFDEAIEEYTHSVWDKLSEDMRKKTPHLKDPTKFTKEEINSVREKTATFKAIIPDVEEKNGTSNTQRSRPSGNGTGSDIPPKTAAQMELDK